MVRKNASTLLTDETATKFQVFTRANITKTPEWERLPEEIRESVMTVSTVLPFRVNRYVMDELIDWDNVPADPMFQLTFPQRGMLSEEHYERMLPLVRGDAPKAEIDEAANQIRLELNPHPAGQLTHNVPTVDGEEIPGVQHKYRETALFFPSSGQTCHAYCTFCFRWAQFVGMNDLKFASREASQMRRYLEAHPEITDVLITGGDPMVMKAKVFAAIVDEIIKVETVRTVRIGTKSVAYWPHRFVTDADADEMLQQFERIAEAGKHVAIMGHYNHPVELSTDIAEEAVRRIRSAGGNIRMQSPIIRHINDDPRAWAQLWRRGTQLGCIPYYMFVERDTGAQRYFELPLVRAWEIFREAYQRLPGTARTVRGPSMSCFPGKCHILGVTEVGGQKAFILEYLQARDPSLVRQPFFAKYDETATWYDDLKPLTERDAKFFSYPEPAGGVGLTVDREEVSVESN